MSKQVKFVRFEDGEIHGGIRLDSGDVLCGCCGGIMPADEENEEWAVLEEKDLWVDVSDAILNPSQYGLEAR